MKTKLSKNSHPARGEKNNGFTKVHLVIPSQLYRLICSEARKRKALKKPHPSIAAVMRDLMGVGLRRGSLGKWR